MVLTSYLAVFVNKGFTKRILGLNKDESDDILNYLFKVQVENHDLQVRFRWTRYEDDSADLAIWDNRSTYHTATDDYIETGGVRLGDRAVSLGEKPFLDAAGSKGRREALGIPPFQDVAY